MSRYYTKCLGEKCNNSHVSYFTDLAFGIIWNALKNCEMLIASYIAEQFWYSIKCLDIMWNVRIHALPLTYIKK